MTGDVVEGSAREIVAEVAADTNRDVGTDMVPSSASVTLFRTDDPVEVIEKATQVADALKRVLVSRDMIQRIQGREHVLVSGWQTLGSMLGVVPVVIWTKPFDGPAKGWEARVEARTLDGRVIGAAEAMCTRDEKTWKTRDDFALRSMAQTRATSKALRGPLGFVVTLAGYSDTPAEEMPDPGSYAPPRPAAPPPPTGLAPDIRLRLFERFRETGASLEDLNGLLDVLGVPPDDDPNRRVSSMTNAQGESAIEMLDVT